jgi:GntR family transcriptional regulator, transcriptional repressor for pyruvate dehydrogenase complex
MTKKPKATEAKIAVVSELNEPAPRLAARKLRAEILARDRDAYLGSETELMERLQLSRSTLRQAARILEQEQLLTVRRGIGGGYFGSRPDATAIANAASLYLRLQNATFLDVLNSANLINMEIARLAAASKDKRLRGVLGVFLERWRPWTSEPPPMAVFVPADRQLVETLADMAGSPSLTMFLQTVWRFGITESHADIFSDHPERRGEIVRRRIALMEAVIAGDSDIAALIAHRINTLVTEWVKKAKVHDRPAMLATSG